MKIKAQTTKQENTDKNLYAPFLFISLGQSRLCGLNIIELKSVRLLNETLPRSPLSTC